MGDSTDKLWKVDGVLHREDGPAIEHDDGTGTYYQRGKLHRKDGPAMVWARGEEWFLYGRRHRVGGPAWTFAGNEEHPGYKAWCFDGKYHREDGPALEYNDGRKIWFTHGVMTKEFPKKQEWFSVIAYKKYPFPYGEIMWRLVREKGHSARNKTKKVYRWIPWTHKDPCTCRGGKRGIRQAQKEWRTIEGVIAYTNKIYKIEYHTADMKKNRRQALDGGVWDDELIEFIHDYEKEND